MLEGIFNKFFLVSGIDAVLSRCERHAKMRTYKCRTSYRIAINILTIFNDKL
jgi:hypothetical protein